MTQLSIRCPCCLQQAEQTAMPTYPAKDADLALTCSACSRTWWLHLPEGFHWVGNMLVPGRSYGAVARPPVQGQGDAKHGRR